MGAGGRLPRPSTMTPSSLLFVLCVVGLGGDTLCTSYVVEKVRYVDDSTSLILTLSI